MRSSLSIVALAALSVLYLAVELVPGRFAVTDEVFFKAAGRNWAMTGRFAAPEIVGRLKSGPPLTETYFAQPPLYTFLFGVYTKAAGFGPRRCILFDALIHLLLAWTVCACALKVFELPLWLSALCAALILPLGTVGRPDELAIVFALTAALAFRSSGWLAGIFLGACLATSLTAAVFLGALVIWEHFRTNPDRRNSLRNLAVACATAVAVFAVCAAPILASHPDAYRQLLAHAGSQSPVLSMITGVGAPEARGVADVIRESIRTWRDMAHYGFGHIFLPFGLVFFAAVAWLLNRGISGLRLDRFVVAAILLASIALVLAGKYFYFWFISVWLLMASAALLFRIWTLQTPVSVKRILLCAGLGVWGISCLPYLQQKAVTWTIPADQSLSLNYTRVRDAVPPGAGVLSTDFWWMLADRDDVYDTLFSTPDVRQVSYIVLSGNGSGKPGKPTGLNPRYDSGGYEVIYNHLNQSPASLFGRTISHSAYGFGAYILKRSAVAAP